MYIGFDFGYKRIGVATGQDITKTAQPLTTLNAKKGIPDWPAVDKLIKEWRPKALVVGLPTCIDDTEQYTTGASKAFAASLEERYTLPVYMTDERLSTVEARARLFEEGGYRKIKGSEVDCVAACIILEQWLNHL